MDSSSLSRCIPLRCAERKGEGKILRGAHFSLKPCAAESPLRRARCGRTAPGSDPGVALCSAAQAAPRHHTALLRSSACPQHASPHSFQSSRSGRVRRAEQQRLEYMVCKCHNFVQMRRLVDEQRRSTRNVFNICSIIYIYIIITYIFVYFHPVNHTPPVPVI